jgi:hypothetical protein
MSEINKLANEIALETAKEVLKGHTLVVEIDGVRYQDIDTDYDGVPLGIQLKRELRYLKLRNGLIWHPTQPNLVAIVKADGEL